MFAVLRSCPWWLKPIFAIGVLAAMAAALIAGSSVAFVLLAGLSKHYPLTSVETYHQWLDYLPYYRNLSVLFWLVLSPVLPATVIGLVVVRSLPARGGARPLYGETRPATRGEMQDAGLHLRHKL